MPRYFFDKKRIVTRYNEIAGIDAEVSVEPRFTSQHGVVDLLYHVSEGKAVPTKRAGP
jgi:hypothetical protein